MMYFHQGDFAVVACTNGRRSAEIIKSHFESICSEAISHLEKKEKLSSGEEIKLKLALMVKEVKTPMINVNCAVFGDGELLPTIERSVREKDIYLIQNTFDPAHPEKTSDNIMELLFSIDALKRSSCSSITVIIPYLSYSKQERRQGRQSLSAKVLIDLLNVAGANKLITLDLHAPAIEGFTSARDMTIDPLFASSVFIDYLRKKDFDGVLVAPDVGAGKMIKHYSKVLNLPFALGYKFRKPDSKHTFETQDVLGDVDDKDVVVIDDQIASGSTLINAARMLKDKGAKSVSLLATHGLFIKDAEKKFKEAIDTGHMDEIVVTNSLQYSDEFLARNPHIKVLDVMRLLAMAIYEMQTGGSISGLYKPEVRQSIYGDRHEI